MKNADHQPIPPLEFRAEIRDISPLHQIMVHSDVITHYVLATPHSPGYNYKTVIGWCYQTIEGTDHIIEYVSRLVFPPQTTWDPLKLKLYSYYHTLHMLYPILHGRHFTLFMNDIYWEHLVRLRARQNDPLIAVWYESIVTLPLFDFTCINFPLSPQELANGHLTSLVYFNRQMDQL